MGVSSEDARNARGLRGRIKTRLAGNLFEAHTNAGRLSADSAISGHGNRPSADVTDDWNESHKDFDPKLYRTPEEKRQLRRNTEISGTRGKYLPAASMPKRVSFEVDSDRTSTVSDPKHNFHLNFEDETYFSDEGSEAGSQDEYDDGSDDEFESDVTAGGFTSAQSTFQSIMSKHDTEWATLLGGLQRRSRTSSFDESSRGRSGRSSSAVDTRDRRPFYNTLGRSSSAPPRGDFYLEQPRSILKKRDDDIWGSDLSTKTTRFNPDPVNSERVFNKEHRMSSDEDWNTGNNTTDRMGGRGYSGSKSPGGVLRRRRNTGPNDSSPGISLDTRPDSSPTFDSRNSGRSQPPPSSQTSLPSSSIPPAHPSTDRSPSTALRSSLRPLDQTRGPYTHPSTDSTDDTRDTRGSSRYSLSTRTWGDLGKGLARGTAYTAGTVAALGSAAYMSQNPELLTTALSTAKNLGASSLDTVSRYTGGISSAAGSAVGSGWEAAKSLGGDTAGVLGGLSSTASTLAGNYATTAGDGLSGLASTGWSAASGALDTVGSALSEHPWVGTAARWVGKQAVGKALETGIKSMLAK